MMFHLLCEVLLSSPALVLVLLRFCSTILKGLGLEGKLTADQIAKKWDNLRTKYKVRGVLLRRTSRDVLHLHTNIVLSDVLHLHTNGVLLVMFSTSAQPMFCLEMFCFSIPTMFCQTFSQMFSAFTQCSVRCSLSDIL